MVLQWLKRALTASADGGRQKRSPSSSKAALSQLPLCASCSASPSSFMQASSASRTALALKTLPVLPGEVLQRRAEREATSLSRSLEARSPAVAGFWLSETFQACCRAAFTSGSLSTKENALLAAQILSAGLL